MNANFEDQYLDVLQNIEWGLLATVKTQPELCDHDMLCVIEHTIAYYKSADKNDFLMGRKLTHSLQEIFQRVSSMCDWRLGARSMTADNEPLTCEPISVDELLQCLK